MGFFFSPQTALGYGTLTAFFKISQEPFLCLCSKYRRSPVLTQNHILLKLHPIREEKPMADSRRADPFSKGVVKPGQQVGSGDTRRCHPPKPSSPKLLLYF